MAFAKPSQADVKLPDIFSDNMILQREQPVPVWGTADPGEKVKINLNGQSVSATAGKDGRWMVHLGKMSAGGPFDMTVSGHNTVTFSNVLVGEVWLCSGQSNMWWTIDREKGIDDIVKASIIPTSVFSLSGRRKTNPTANVLSGKSALPKTFRNFSAVSFFFGKHLYDEMRIPVGLIHSSMGGSVPRHG